MSNLKIVTGGLWLPDEDPDSDEFRLFIPDYWTPHSALDLVIALSTKSGVATVSLPGGSWVVHPYVTDDGEVIRYEGFRRTIFCSYHKNVLGLPFLSAPGIEFVFDDRKELLYLVERADDGAVETDIALASF